MKLWHDYVSVKVLIIPSAANQCKYWKLSSKEEELIKNSGHYFYFSLFSHWAPAQTANSLIVWYIYEGFTLWLDSIAMLMPVCLSCRQKPKGAQSGRAENRWLSGNPVCPSIIDTQSRESRVCVCVCLHPTVPLPLGVSAFYKPPLILCLPSSPHLCLCLFVLFYIFYTIHRKFSWKVGLPRLVD